MSDQSAAAAKRDAAVATRKAAADEIAEIDGKLASATDFDEKVKLRTRRIVLETDIEGHDKAVSAAERELLDAAGVGKPALTIRRSQFDTLPQREQVDFLQKGGRITDDPEPPKKTGPVGANQIRREDFDRMSQVDRAAAMKAGKTVVD